MKLSLSHYGLMVSSLALAPMVIFGISSLHSQGKTSAETVATVDSRATYKTEVKQDINEQLYWTISLDLEDGKKIGDIIGGYKIGKLGARTVISIPRPGKNISPDQAFRVDQTTGQILEIFSLSQLLKEQTQEGKK